MYVLVDVPDSGVLAILVIVLSDVGVLFCEEALEAYEEVRIFAC